LDRIYIRDMLLRCILGVYEEERREKQDVVINICLYTDLRKAGKTDRIEDSVDYKAIKKGLLRFVEESSFYLLEALTEAIAVECLKHKGVRKVDVRVEKPGALRFAKTVGVEITRPWEEG